MSSIFIWIISILSIAGVIIRPFRWPEMIWALSGALLLLLTRLLSVDEGLAGVLKGLDVYLFLTGMMLLSETAREEKLFDWLAVHATRLSNGSGLRLFGLIYAVGIAVTVFLSNDATAVVLTPAVAAAVKAAKVSKPLPYLFVCAFIANAASFVLPISNPANLVIYGAALPPLFKWVPLYFLPSLTAIAVTFFVLRARQRKMISESIASGIPVSPLSPTGRLALAGIFFTAVVLMICSGKGIALGLPTAITGIITSVVILLSTRKSPVTVIKGVSWSVLPLVAGLFVIVEGLSKTGFTRMLSEWLSGESGRSPASAMWISGLVTAYGSNGMNNLPAGLIAGSVIQSASVPEMVRSAILVGIDLGPNLSVTGSLATILWLTALRREGIEITAAAFLKIGLTVMTAALLATLAVIGLTS